MSTHRQLSHFRATFTALFVTLLWSSSWILIRWGLDQEALEPITFAALRYGLASVLLFGWVLGRPRLRRELLRVDRASTLQVLFLGVTLYALTQGAQFVAIDSQPAATSSLVLSWTPLIVAVFGGWSIAERTSRRQFLGALLVVIGAWLYFSGDLGATLVGMTAAILGLAANAVAALLGRSVNRRAQLGPVVVTALSMGVGALILIGVGLVLEGLPEVSGRAWLIIIWLAAVNTAFAFTLWNLSLRRLPAVESAAINNTMLIQIAVLAWLFLDEPLGLAEIAGVGLVSIGILMTQTVLSRRTKRD